MLSFRTVVLSTLSPPSLAVYQPSNALPLRDTFGREPYAVPFAMTLEVVQQLPPLASKVMVTASAQWAYRVMPFVESSAVNL